LDAVTLAEFAREQSIRLDPLQRREIVREMRPAGMTTRAIETRLNVSHGTVVADLAGGQNRPPARVLGRDGRS
jgi:IS30 family transposase